jgi:hypothetical protein
MPYGMRRAQIPSMRAVLEWLLVVGISLRIVGLRVALLAGHCLAWCSRRLRREEEIV